MLVPDWRNAVEAHELLSSRGRSEAHPLLAQSDRISGGRAAPASILGCSNWFGKRLGFGLRLGYRIASCV